ncbi:MAG: preprotein translocase subunit SecG [Phascolarctobacterium sp.]|nr:preprotein translocase subunit SecG [Candidatus Phascolarctobacterium caballi]
MLETILLILDAVVSVGIIFSVLMQSGKAGVGSTFGGSEGSFMGKGKDKDTIFSKITLILGILFAVITLILAKLNM